MRADHATAHGNKTVELVVSIIVGSIAMLVINTLPVFLTTITRMLGFGEAQAGQMAFVELGGLTLGTIILAIFSSLLRVLTWRGLASGGLIIFAAANVASSYIGDFPMFVVMRFVAGLGASMTLAVVYAALADAGGARALAIFNVVQLASGWFGMVILSDAADPRAFASLFRYLALLSCLGVFLALKLVGDDRAENVDTVKPEHHSTFAGGLSVFGVFLYFCGMGAMYTFLGYMGRAWGGDPKTVDLEVSITVFAAMLGGLAAAGLGLRLGQKIPLRLGYAVLFLSIIIAGWFHPVRYFAVIISVFAFSWNIVAPFQFGIITTINRSSSIAIWVNVALLGGLAVGPAAAGVLITPSFDYVTMLALALGVVSWICVEADLLIFDRNIPVFAKDELKT